MRYSVGDCVKNTIKKKYSNGDVIETSTSGNVLKVYPFSKSYSVMFSGAQTSHRVLETQLIVC